MSGEQSPTCSNNHAIIQEINSFTLRWWHEALKINIVIFLSTFWTSIQVHKASMQLSKSIICISFHLCHVSSQSSTWISFLSLYTYYICHKDKSFVSTWELQKAFFSPLLCLIILHCCLQSEGIFMLFCFAWQRERKIKHMRLYFVCILFYYTEKFATNYKRQINEVTKINKIVCHGKQPVKVELFAGFMIIFF
jgi:hypothetical protein